MGKQGSVRFEIGQRAEAKTFEPRYRGAWFRCEVTLLESPRGEGSSYIDNRKDLRPSLNWSPVVGWTVPAPSVGGCLMGKQGSVRFEIGQRAEAKTFEPGYRGAWFRCEIKKVIKTKGHITAYRVEYYDYPEESQETKKLYEFPRGSHSQKAKKNKEKELMVRPEYPPTYPETNLPLLNTISQVIVAVADSYSLGDLVDWFSDGCFWSATLTQLFDDQSVEVTLLEPPRGEGSSYIVNRKDLRPSLNWSPEVGWTVPAPSESQRVHLLARLIQPLEQVPLSKSLADEMDEEKQNVKVTPRSSLELDQSMSSHTSVSSLLLQNRSLHSEDSLHLGEGISKKRMMQKYRLNTELDIGGSAIGKPSCSDSVSSTLLREVHAEVPEATCAEELDHENGSAKNSPLNEKLSLNITASDSIESAILDLEELVNRVKWMKQILKNGMSSNHQGPAWEFLERSSPSTKN